MAGAGPAASQKAQHQQQWGSPVWACWADWSIAGLGSLCSVCLMADNVSRLDGEYGPACCTGVAWACLHALLSCALLGGSVRGQLRDKFGLPGSTCGDYAVHTLLPWCAVCQEAREIKRRSVLLMQPAAAAEALADTQAPQMQLMQAGGGTKDGPLVGRWVAPQQAQEQQPAADTTPGDRGGSYESGAGAGAAGGRASAVSPVAGLPPVVEGDTSGEAETEAEAAAISGQQRQSGADAEQQPPATTGAGVGQPDIEALVSLESQRVEHAVQAARRIERQASQRPQRGST